DGTSRLITFEFGASHPDRAAPVSAGELRSTAERITGQPLPFVGLEFSGRFSDFSRLADTYRSGRLLLAGDAAHVHFPVGGQGLNLGIQDAFNLSWKLAAVIRGGADDALLDTYTAERRPYAQRVITYTHEQAAAMDPRPGCAAERVILLQHVDGGRRQAALADMVSSQDVGTQRAADDHEAVGTFAVDRAIRSRGEPTRLSALLAGGRGILLAPAALASRDRIEHGWRGRVDVVVDDAQAGATLLRPDGYVAWAADDAVVHPRAERIRLLDTLTRWFGPEVAPPRAESAAATRVVAVG
ncbi:MAG: FAD-dependent monooxygenase, partial [Solirubrobacteraceae bacterium]|nr:FAD-dependent monooxygenase [Solirubrobacteraceae bacterium]